METDETIVLYSEGIPETEVFKYQELRYKAAEGGTERHQMLLSPIPVSLKTLLCCCTYLRPYRGRKVDWFEGQFK